MRFEDLLGFLCGASFVLATIAVLGHGLWLLAAMIVRVLSGNSSPSTSSTTTHKPSFAGGGSACESCGSPQSVWQGSCRVCGALTSVTDALRYRQDLLATARELGRMRQLEVITAEQFQLQMEFVAKELLQLGISSVVAETSATSPSPTPAAAETVTVASLATPSTTAPAIGEPMAGAVEEVIVAAEMIGEPAAIALSATGATQHQDLPGAALAAPASVDAMPTPSIQPVVVPQRGFADMLQAFMEKKNIRWGELLSGILIVVSAVGLVISLRATLKDTIPYFPALMFMLITGAIHFAGIYSLRRWNLKATSRGVLIIATLLIPLNFLAAVILSGNAEQQRSVGDPTFWLAIVIGVGAFGAMNYFAARALLRVGWWRLCLAVLGTSVSQLLINRLTPLRIGAVSGFILLSVALVSFLISVAWAVRVASNRRNFTGRSAILLFLETALALFALLVPIGLLVSKTSSIGDTFAALSPTLSLASAAILALGLVVHSRALRPTLAAYRTAGTSIALFGAGMLVVMLVLAWPKPDLLIAVGLLNGLILVTLAVVANLPALEIGAIACLALATLVGFHVSQRAFEMPGIFATQQMLNVLTLGRSSIVLTVFAALTTIIALRLRRDESRDASPPTRSQRRAMPFVLTHSLSVLIGAGCVAVVALVGALYAGFLDQQGLDTQLMTPLLLCYGVAVLAASVFVPRQEISWIAAGVIWLGFLHALWKNDWLRGQLGDVPFMVERPVVAATWLHALLAAAIAVFACVRNQRSASSLQPPRFSEDEFIQPWSWSALISTVACLPFVVLVLEHRFATHACFAAGLAFVFGQIWYVQRAAWLLHAAQLIATLAVAFATTAFCLTRSWWSFWWIDPRHIQWQLGALTIWSVLASVVRQLLLPMFRRSPLPSDANEIATPPDRFTGEWWTRLTVDQVVMGGAIRALFVLGVLACWPGVLTELGCLHTERLSEVTIARNHDFTMLAASGWSWFVALLMLAALAVYFRERQSRLTIGGVLIVLGVLPLLLAARWDSQQAVASGLRWLFAGYAVMLALPAWIWGGPAQRETADPRARNWARVLRGFAVAAGLFFVAGLTFATFVQVAGGERLGGPDAASIFGRIGSAISFATPLGLLVLVMLAFAIREGRPDYAMLGSFLFQFTVSLACILPAITAGSTFDESLAAKLIQWNSLGLAAYTLIWLGTRSWIEPGRDDTGLDLEHVGWLDWQLLAVAVANLLLGVLSAAHLIVEPHVLAEWQRVAAAPLSYVGLLAACGAGWWYMRHGSWISRTRLLAGTACGLVAIAAVSLHVADGPGRWCGLHSLLVGWLLIATTMTAVAWVLNGRTGVASSLNVQHLVTIAERWGGWLSLVIVVVAMRGAFSDPERPWWSSGLVLGVVLLVSALAWRGRRQGRAFCATALAGLVMILFWMGYGARTASWNDEAVIATVAVAVLMLGCVWLGAEVWYQKRIGEEFDPGWRVVTVPRFLAVLGTAAGLLWFWAGFVFTHLFTRQLVAQMPPWPSWLMNASVLLLLGGLLIGSLWLRTATYCLHCLYGWGLCVVAFGLRLSPLTMDAAVVATSVALACYVAATGYLWRNGLKLAFIGQRLGVPDPVAGLKRVARWLPFCSLALTAVGVIAALVMVLNSDDRVLRVASAFAPLVAAGGIGLQAQKERRTVFQFLALVLVVIAAVFSGWADIGAGHEASLWLARLIRLMMVLAVATFLYGAVVVRMLPISSDWRAVMRSVAVTMGGAALVALLGILGIELALFTPGVGAPLDTPQVIAVAVVLVGLVAGLLSLAVLPGRDPLTLNEEGRMFYVYGAQLVAALLFAHLYLARPQWFDGVLKPWWPYILMAIAFGGVSVGEIFQRLGWRVLSEPLQRTGAFLPLMPVVGMWIVSSDSDYSLLLFVVGVLYIGLTIARRSWVSGVAAAVAGNGSLWSFLLNHANVPIWQHPQFWLIPPAACVLVAAQLNRDRLSAANLTSVRYLCMLVIYISSTSEIFIRGIGESLWPPMILVLLSIAGVFVGIAFRVRAFLYLGCSFALLAMVSMVWHASRSIQHSWPWWAFGFLSGLSILVFFGLFEKKRPEILRLVERIRQWEQ